MVTPSQLTSNLLVKVNQATHQTLALPTLIFFPTARCNSRCVSCDWWKADGADDLSLEEVRGLANELPALRTRSVVFSGGEPLFRRDVFELADLFTEQGQRLHLLTSGLLLDRHAAAVGAHFGHVTISLDGHTPALYEQIRGVNGLPVVEAGIRKLQAVSPRTPVRARSTLHRQNFAALPALIDKAHAIGLAGISFLAADVSSEAFGRTSRSSGSSMGSLRTAASTTGLLLDAADVQAFAEIVERTIVSHAADFASGFVAEPPEKLRRLPRYYAAQLGLGPLPGVQCNAPWASAVVEADGAVRGCFFHRIVGNIRARGLRAILRDEMVAFRRGLSVAHNPVCARCVCTLLVGLRSPS